MFSIGDVVKLKSGSDKMTVSSVSGDNVTCIWFPIISYYEINTNGDVETGPLYSLEYHSATFPSTALVAA